MELVESIPRIIHQLLRLPGKFIAVNCSAIPEGTIDSELFGHEKGLYRCYITSGYFEEADGGTIFLDEVGGLNYSSALIGVWKMVVLKVGSSQVQKTNVRIIAATNLDMSKAIQKFRRTCFIV